MQSHDLDTSTSWVLSACSAEVAELGEVEIHQFPFRIGRMNQLELTLPLRTVSGQHASISQSNGKMFIEDAGSRNGTFVNGDRISGKTSIKPGDLIQLAQAIFRVENNCAEELFSQTINPMIVDNALAVVEFDRLMADKLVVPHFQSIVYMDTEEIYGYEALGRGGIETLRSPKDMFCAAERMQQEGELSRLLRRTQTEAAKPLPLDNKLFLNSHQCEFDDQQKMIDSVWDLRQSFPDRQIVLEIHESTVTDLQQMEEIGAQLKEMNVEIAYDDFGAGQARFFELIEEPPTYLKFDIRLMKNLHLASPRRRRTIEGLVNMVDGLGITCLAEGIEVADEAKACRDLGFKLAQGYYYSRPETIDAILADTNSAEREEAIKQKLNTSF